MAAAAWVYGIGAAFGRARGRDVQDVVHEFLVGEEPFVWREVLGAGAEREDTAHGHVRRSEFAGRNGDDNHVQEGVLRDGIDGGAGGDSGDDSDRGVLLGMAGVVGVAGEVGGAGDTGVTAGIRGQESGIRGQEVRSGVRNQSETTRRILWTRWAKWTKWMIWTCFLAKTLDSQWLCIYALVRMGLIKLTNLKSFHQIALTAFGR